MLNTLAANKTKKSLRRHHSEQKRLFFQSVLVGLVDIFSGKQGINLLIPTSKSTQHRSFNLKQITQRLILSVAQYWQIHQSGSEASLSALVP